MVVGDKGYQFKLTGLAYNFSGGVSMEYLQSCGYRRIKELNDHADRIAQEIKASG